MTSWEIAQRVLSDAATTTADPRVTRALAFIGAHLDRPIHLNEVAAVAAVEPKHFSRLFHRKTGWRFADLVELLRVLRAQELLATPRSVADVAQRVGYRDLGTFERAFRRRTGLSPRSYRAAAPQRGTRR